MTDEKRPYRKRKRAELEAETRRRITESAVELHGTLGPSRTSMSALAEHAGVRRSTLYRHFADEMEVFAACSAHWNHAGVRRSTLYRHFADEMEVFAACSAHWNEAHPVPDLGAWAAIEDPDARLRAALEELYAFYRGGEGMIANLSRDESVMPTVAHYFGAFHEYLAAAGEVLMGGRGLRGRARARVRAAVGHALEFSTWRSLARGQGLADDEAARLMCGLVEAAR